jgi:hypothetical protein
MKLKRLERRKMRRHSESFKNTEERDAFLAEKFPVLIPAKKSGYFATPNGVTVAVWMTRVLWSEPHALATD